MRFTSINLVALSAFALQVSSKTIQVTVGKGGLVFEPNTIHADTGDIVEYHYFPKSHSVAQGDFNKGCAPLDAGFFSGFMPTSDGEAPNVFRLTVQHTNPVFFYCTQGNHCGSGMVGVINPNSEFTLEMYKKTAAGSGATIQPAAIGGGEIVKGDTPPSSGSISSGTTAFNSTATTPPTTQTSVEVVQTTSTRVYTSAGNVYTTIATVTVTQAAPVQTQATGSNSPPASTSAVPGAAGHVSAAIGGAAALAIGISALFAF